MLILSVGGLLGQEEWFGEAREKGCRIYIPSGAIAGLDGVKFASMGRIARVLLTSRKRCDGTKPCTRQPRGRYGHLQRARRGRGSRVSGDGERSGFAALGHRSREVGRRTGPDHLRAGRTENIHEICVDGEFGRFTVKVENRPSSANPRTSQLAAFSAIATLKNLTRSLHVGT
jgi:aspartate dehydrogenase